MAAAFRGRPYGQGAGSVLVPPGSGSGSPAPDPAEVLGGVGGGEGGEDGGGTGGVAWADRDGVVPCGCRCRWAGRCRFAGCRCRACVGFGFEGLGVVTGATATGRGFEGTGAAAGVPDARWPMAAIASTASASAPSLPRLAAARCAAPAAAAAPGARRHRRRTARPIPPPRCGRRPRGPRYRTARARQGTLPASRTLLRPLARPTPRAAGPVRNHPRRAGSQPACAVRRAAPPGSD